MNEPPPAGGEASGSAAAKDIYSYSDLVVVSTGTFAGRDRVLCPVGAGCPCSDPEGNPRGAGPGVRRDEIGRESSSPEPLPVALFSTLQTFLIICRAIGLLHYF